MALKDKVPDILTFMFAFLSSPLADADDVQKYNRARDMRSLTRTAARLHIRRKPTLPRKNSWFVYLWIEDNMRLMEGMRDIHWWVVHGCMQTVNQRSHWRCGCGLHPNRGSRLRFPAQSNQPTRNRSITNRPVWKEWNTDCPYAAHPNSFCRHCFKPLCVEFAFKFSTRHLLDAECAARPKHGLNNMVF